MYGCMYNACKTHLHTKQWEQLFYLWRTSQKNFITQEAYTQLLWKWSQNVHKTWKKKVTKSRRIFCSRCEVIAKNVEGGLIKTPPPPAFLGLSNIDCFAHFITLLIALLIWATLLYTSISFSVSSTIHECFQSSTCLPIVISLQALHIIFKLWRKLFFF